MPNSILEDGPAQPDAFEKSPEQYEGNGVLGATGKLPDDFDELPIELVSLSDT